ncbi:hypothetical protein [Paenibacillus sp. FSL R5-0765]|uniref:hypothetical protein n=1 Tax=unclassified Paenibacillus TaxID=185978 RepID=UPI0026AAB813
MLSSRTSTVSSPATGTGSTVSGLIRLLRPKQWTKNLLLFAALLFSFEEIRTETILATLLGFILFSLVAGCVYILNDFVDRDRDQLICLRFSCWVEVSSSVFVRAWAKMH